MKRLSALLLGFSLAFLWGCATIPGLPDLKRTLTGEKDPLPEMYRTKAREAEKQGQFQMALLSWQVASRLEPTDEQAANSLAELRARTRREADKHFQKGLAYYRQDSLEEARREFLITLRYKPDHKEALSYLKERLGGRECTFHQVTEGETLGQIARQAYGDSRKSFLVAYFNDLDPEAPPAPGTLVKLPLLDVQVRKKRTRTRPAINLQEELAQARDLFAAEEYREVLSVAAKVLKHDQGNKEAARLKNESYYQLGLRLKRQEKYLESLEMFTQVDPEYKDVSRAVAEVTRVLRRQAERHYRRGVNYYVNEQLEKAIAEWETTLRLNPAHQRARQDIENARSLLKKLEEDE